MSGLIYSVVFEEVAVTADQDLFEIVAPSDAAVLIHVLTLSQSSDAGDSESELLSILMHRGTTSGSGGSAATPRPMQAGFPAAGSTVEVNNTTKSTEGVQLYADAFNVQLGLQKIWTPETRPVISPSGRIVIEVQTAPADSITMSGTLIFEEIGG
jgi:hypothetical protein